MDVFDVDVDVVEEVGVELDGVAGREEHHDFSLPVFLEECEQQAESLVWVAHHEALLEAFHGRVFCLFVDSDEDRVFEREPDQVVDLLGLRGGEENGLALFGNDAEDLPHFFLEALLEDLVCFVDDEAHEVVEGELGVLQVVQQAAGRRDDDRGPFGELDLVLLPVLAPDQQCDGLVVVGQQVDPHVEDLLGQLARRRDDDHTCAFRLRELDLVQDLQCWDQKSEGFARAGLCRAEQVLAFQQPRDRLGLDVRHFVKLHLFLYCLLRGLADIQLVE